MATAAKKYPALTHGPRIKEEKRKAGERYYYGLWRDVGLAGHPFSRILSNALSYKSLLRCLRHVCMPVALLESYLQGAGLLGPSGCAHSSPAHGGVLVNLACETLT